MSKSLKKVWLASAVLRGMQLEAARAFPLETGGVLVGYQSNPQTELVVTSFAGPGPNAQHLRARFVPDYDYHLSELSRFYYSSGRLERYVGDWHTHPLGAATLSGTDLKTLETISSYRGSRLPNPIMIVLYERDWRCTTWELRRRGIGRLGMCRVNQLETQIYAE